jgi:hypothetical protein
MCLIIAEQYVPDNCRQYVMYLTMYIHLKDKNLCLRNKKHIFAQVVLSPPEENGADV